ncbi:PIN domain-containing protein [Methanomethylovorans sp.]|jgi:predicted nucleic acid-binding protein|uniref:PIN domain-containing protein n=1 Tax=Methanomethylovorans sp. TaxID=2758717 RepID=UPI003D10C8CD
MEFVIDANIILSALIATEGKTFALIFNDHFKLFAPEFLLEEVGKYKDLILRKSGLKEEDFQVFLSFVSSRIEFIPYEEFKGQLKRAAQITPDPKDTEYIALALKLKCGVWSNDKVLKEQDAVKVYSTTELINELEL